MKALCLALVFGALACAQSPLSFYIDNADGSQTPFPANYQFPDTPVGASSSITVTATNSSNTTITVLLMYISDGGSTTSSPNFNIANQDIRDTLAPGYSETFTINFTPSTAGSLSAYLEAQLAGSTPLSNPPPIAVATLQGNGLQNGPGPELTLTCNGNAIATDASINFGIISTNATAAQQCTVVNGTAAGISISLATERFNTSAFTAPNLPMTIAAGATGSFTVTFAPGNPGTYQTTLSVGPNSDTLMAGAVGPVTISYVDSTGVSLNAQSATPIDFGQAITGNATLTFTVTNPITNADPVTISGISVSGAAFAASFSASPLPACSAAVPGANTLQPGACINFQVVFSPSGSGNFSGSLTIGPNQFTLTGEAPPPIGSGQSALPGIALICGSSACASQTFSSGQQVKASLQLSSPSPVNSDVTLTMAFQPISGLPDDPSISFIAPFNMRELAPITFTTGSKTGTMSGQSQFTFQTGTTAGTITFTLSYLGQTITLVTIDIPRAIEITSMTATQSDPNLIVQIDGFDNTYSAGPLSFAFSTTTAGTITVNADETPAFHQLFFTNNTAGGAFSLQATFPVTGNVTSVTSVSATLSNPSGQTANQTQAFQ